MSRLQSRLLSLAVQLAIAAVAVGASAAPLAPLQTEVSVAAAHAKPDAGSLDDVPAVGDAELAKARGGFTAGGVTFDIGATVQTTINGTLAMVSTLNLTSTGQVQQTTQVNPNLPNATLITPGNVGTVSSTTGINLNGVPNASGVVVPGTDGYTAVLSNVTQNALQNLVVNTANGQTITQNTTLNVTLPGFAANQLQAARSNVFNQLNSALNTVQLGLR